MCSSLEGQHIWVAFNASYERGSFVKRNAYTAAPNRFIDADGQCSEGEVCLIWTDHRTALSVHKRVELCHLKPAAPRSKGEQVVILTGEKQGQLGMVEACRKKTSDALVMIGDTRFNFSFSEICRVTSPA